MDYQLELRHLQYFRILAEELHFRKAAERLFIAQPGLSRQIKQLEAYYGATLFYRDKRNVELTVAGKFLQSEIALVFSHLDKIKEQIAKINAGKITSLKLGFIGSAVQAILPQLLVNLKQQQPLIDITLSELSNERQLELLLKNQMDFGFVRMENIKAPLKSMPILTDHFSLVVPKNEANKSIKKVDLKKYQQESFILFSREYSNSYYDLVMSIFRDHGFEPHVSLNTVNALSIFSLVSQGLGVAIVPSSLKKGYHTHVDFLDLSHLSQRTTLSLVWNQENRNLGIPLLLQIVQSMMKINKT